MFVVPLLFAVLSSAKIHSAPTIARIPIGDTAVPNSYAVVLKSHVIATEHLAWVRDLQPTASDGRAELRKRGEPQIVLSESGEQEGVVSTFDFGDELRGYDIHADREVIERIRNHPDVDFVESNHYVYALDQDLYHSEPALSQDNAPWGLGRISHQDHENVSWPYSFSKQGLGEGVDVYVLDSGVFAEHEDFEGRVVTGISFLPDDNSTTDHYYHGTHCAGTIAGKQYGIAKAATIVPVKVLGNNGIASSSILKTGMGWALTRHNDKKNSAEHRKTFRGSVVNLSVGVARLETVNRLAKVMTENGMHVVAAAGNEAADACKTSPASSDFVVTVGAIDARDRFASPFSNWGSCVDVNAPGVAIRSAGLDNTTAERIASGTSMAAPHVAGIIASLLSRQPVDVDSEQVFSTITPKQLKEDLLKIASKGLIPDNTLQHPNTTNAIAYHGGPESDYSKIISRGGWPECCRS